MANKDAGIYRSIIADKEQKILVLEQRVFNLEERLRSKSTAAKISEGNATVE